MKRNYLSLIRKIEDFPNNGITFQNLNGIYENPKGLEYLSQDMVRLLELSPIGDIGSIAGIEARGFILSAYLAAHFQCGFIPIRKEGKTPPPFFTEKYDLEYGTDVLELGVPATVQQDKHIVIHDDILATGGTALAALKLCEHLVPREKITFLFTAKIASLNGEQFLLNAGVAPTNILTLINLKA